MSLSRENMLDELISSVEDESVAIIASTRGRWWRRGVRGIAALGVASSAVLLPAALAAPGATASAEVTANCSNPRFQASSHTRYCPNGVSHYTHNYARTTHTSNPGYYQTCHHFSSYGWMIGCQHMVGPFSTKTCQTA